MTQQTISENNTDLALLNRCLNSSPRYAIPEHLREKMVSKLSNLMDCGRAQTAIKAVQTLVDLDRVNLEILKAMKPKRSESMVINVTKLSDQELLEAIRNVEKLLPRAINVEPIDGTDGPD